MGFINTGIGAIALALGYVVIWGVIAVLEIVIKALGKDASLYFLLALPVLFFCYLLGEGIQANRKSHSKSH